MQGSTIQTNNNEIQAFERKCQSVINPEAEEGYLLFDFCLLQIKA